MARVEWPSGPGTPTIVTFKVKGTWYTSSRSAYTRRGRILRLPTGKYYRTYSNPSQCLTGVSWIAGLLSPRVIRIRELQPIPLSLQGNEVEAYPLQIPTLEESRILTANPRSRAELVWIIKGDHRHRTFMFTEFVIGKSSYPGGLVVSCIGDMYPIKLYLVFDARGRLNRMMEYPV